MTSTSAHFLSTISTLKSDLCLNADEDKMRRNFNYSSGGAEMMQTTIITVINDGEEEFK